MHHYLLSEVFLLTRYTNTTLYYMYYIIYQQSILTIYNQTDGVKALFYRACVYSFNPL